MTSALKRFETMGARQIEHDHLNGEFHVQFGGDVSGRYLTGAGRANEATLDLGPLVVNMPWGARVTAWVAGPCILDPAEVKNVIATMNGEQLRGAIHEAGYIRIGKDGDFRLTRLDIEDQAPVGPWKLHRHQWVEHPHWGRGQVEDFALAPDVKVRFGKALETVDASNLTPIPYLGNRWAFELGPTKGGHCQVVVRSGQPGSRAFLGSLLLGEGEAEDFELAMSSLGAIVMRT